MARQNDVREIVRPHFTQPRGPSGQVTERMSGIRAEQDEILGQGEASQNVLLVVETFAELDWEAENGGYVWQNDWKSHQAL
jgi:hypothetical protein